MAELRGLLGEAGAHTQAGNMCGSGVGFVRLLQEQPDGHFSRRRRRLSCSTLAAKGRMIVGRSAKVKLWKKVLAMTRLGDRQRPGQQVHRLDRRGETNCSPAIALRELRARCADTLWADMR